jgi:hypothetical protein
MSHYNEDAYSAGHIARMGKMRCAYNILVRKPEGEDNLEDLGIDGRIIFG